ncbi:hypothetical protein J4218_06370 [Candidatus Pacearchaeota archaeon]|nr:hypothetical protein [Candidatus Pacearchaeota archaeon]
MRISKRSNSHFELVNKDRIFPSSKRSTHVSNQLPNLIFPDSKRSQSEVVSTVLMILIGIVAVMIIAAFIISFVKGQIDKSKCFDVTDIIEVKNNPTYSCYNSTGKYMLVQVHFAEANALLEGFSLEIGGADTVTYKILNNTAIGVVKMYNGTLTTLTLPGDNSERTYNVSGINTKPDSVKIYPILKGGKTCSSPSILNTINTC